MQLKCVQVFAIALMVFTPSVWAANFATCILNKMPTVKNPASNAAVYRSCGSEHPRRYYEIEKGSGIGFFGPKNPDACIIKHASETTFQPAAAAIAGACQCLYSKPSFKDEMCEYPWGNQ